MGHREDVLVIGGGVIGVCAAYYLLEEGRRVTILERGEVCSGSSYGNSGLIVPSHSIPLAAPGVFGRALKSILDPESPLYVRPRLDPTLVSWLWQFRAACTEPRMRESVRVLLELCHASIGLYDGLIERERLECNYARRGLLMLYNTDHGYQEGLREASLLRDNGLRMTEMSGPAAHEMESSVRADVAGGIHYEEDASLDPAQFVYGLAARVREKGGAIQEGVEVTGFETTNGHISTVRTTSGDFHGEHVVLAAGSWCAGLGRDLGLELPVQPGKGYSVTFEAPQASIGLPVILSEAKVGVNPLGPAIRLAGTVELAGFDVSINARRVDAVVRAAGDYLSLGEGVAAVENPWTGLRPLTPDGLPIIGAARSPANLTVATGHAMLGMTLGPITGKLVAELVCNQEPAVNLAPVSPERFQ